jgi:ComEC/Rec2-related protein
MRRIFLKITAFLGFAFPLLSEWCRLPSFTGWIALSCGIAAQKTAPFNHVFSSLFYNEVSIVAIALSLFAAFVVSFLPIRLLLFACAGFFLASHASVDQHKVYAEAARMLDTKGAVYLRARIESVPMPSYGEYCFIVRADSVFSGTHGSALFGKAMTCYSFTKPLPSGSVTAAGRFKPPLPSQNPGAFDDYSNSMSNNIWGRFYVDTLIDCSFRHSLWNSISNSLRTTVLQACATIRNRDYRAVIIAAFLNDKSGLSTTVRDLFYKAGIYHLLALSGFNIAILATALFAFLSLIPVSKTVKIALVLFCVWSFYFFIGPIPSLFRAVIMTTVVLSAYLFQRKTHGLNSLGLAGILWLFFSPASLFTPSYQLSFSATLGLVMLYPFLSAKYLPRRRKILFTWVLSPFLSTLFVSVAAFVATAPVLAYHFGTLSFSGIIANLFAVALMSIAMWISLIGFIMQFLFPAFVPFCMHAAELVVDAMIRCSSLVTALPLAPARIPAVPPVVCLLYSLFFAGLCAVRSDFTKRYIVRAGTLTFLLCALVFLIRTAAMQPSVTSFFIKKASLTGIRWPDGRLWLIGCGPEGASYSTYSRIIVPWMRQNFSNRIDAVAITDDPGNTVQSLEPLLKNAGVKTIISLAGTPGSRPEFSRFLREFRASMKIVDEYDDFSPLRRCVCMFLPDRVTPGGERVRQVKIALFGTAVIMPDSSCSASECRGAVSLVFSRNNDPVKTQTIPLSHPLYPLLKNVY